jgi:hypothetical protein
MGNLQDCEYSLLPYNIQYILDLMDPDLTDFRFNGQNSLVLPNYSVVDMSILPRNSVSIEEIQHSQLDSVHATLQWHNT